MLRDQVQLDEDGDSDDDSDVAELHGEAPPPQQQQQQETQKVCVDQHSTELITVICWLTAPVSTILHWGLHGALKAGMGGVGGAAVEQQVQPAADRGPIRPALPTFAWRPVEQPHGV